MADLTVKQLVGMGFAEVRAHEAVASIGDPSDAQLAMNWLLDHGEEDQGGAVEFKHCPHVSELAPDSLISTAAVQCGKPCLHGCRGEENWICLMCAESRCGRYANRHSLQHFEQTRAAVEGVLTVAEAAKSEARGHFLVLNQADLSVWCYACESYVKHEALLLHIKRLEALKFGKEEESVEKGPDVGSQLAAEPVAYHGALGNPSWPAPCLARACGDEARPGYKTMRAHEYLDDPDVLTAKVKVLADLVRRSQACVAYTGAGISTASGIRDYATKASGSVGAALGGARDSPYGAPPTFSHQVLTAMHAAGMLKHWVQQNHDGLPQKAGFPQYDVNEVHGAWWDPSNPVVPMSGSLRMDLVDGMYQWAEKADLCLALGTSMVGMNADRVAVDPAQRAQRRQEGALGTVIVALQQTQYDKLASLRIFATIDAVMEKLAAELELVIPPLSVSARIDPNVVHSELPYGTDGCWCPGGMLSLDLRIGSRCRIVNQPDWDRERVGNTCVVVEAPSDLAQEGHVLLKFASPGKVQQTRYLGRWWLEAARSGSVKSLPLVSCK